MALIKCPECGREVSDKAICCVHCGCPIDIKNEPISETKIEIESETIEIKESYSIELLDYKKERNEVISILKNFYEIGFYDAMDKIGSLPCIIGNNMSKDKAIDLAQKLTNCEVIYKVYNNGTEIDFGLEKQTVYRDWSDTSTNKNEDKSEDKNEKNSGCLTGCLIPLVLVGAGIALASTGQTIGVILLFVLVAIALIMAESSFAEQDADKLKRIRDFNNGNGEKDENGMLKCPYCGSTQIQITKRGYKVTSGFIGSGQNERVCLNCMKKL